MATATKVVGIMLMGVSLTLKQNAAIGIAANLIEWGTDQEEMLY